MSPRQSISSRQSMSPRQSISKKKSSNNQNSDVFEIIESGSNREISENTYRKTPKGNYKTNYEKSEILVKIKEV